MTGVSKVEKHGFTEQVAQWLEEGKTEAWIAKQLNERKPEANFNQSNITRFKLGVLKRVNRLQQRKAATDKLAHTWSQDVADALSIIQRSIDKTLDRPWDQPWDRDTRETVHAELEIAREKLKLLRQYEPESQVNVAVGVKVEQDTLAILNKWLES